MFGGTVGFFLAGLAVVVYANKAPQLRKWTRPAQGRLDGNIPQDQWFTQPLNHYDITNTNRWEQRYQVIDEYYRSGGPAFLILSGNWESKVEKMRSNSATAYASKLGGIVFQLEHRFYGKSRPTSDVSLENLRYLSADQALADAAFFIVGMNEMYRLPKETKWVTFGTSYGGALSAWIRDKFPHLVYASVAYSAPVLATLDFFEYKAVVGVVLSRVSRECLNSVKEAHSQLKTFVRESTDFTSFNTNFKLCDSFENAQEKDIESLLEVTSDNIGVFVQYNNILGTTIENTCNVMKDESLGSLLDRYAVLSSMILKGLDKNCLDFKYYNKVQRYKNVNWDSEMVESGERQWMYQTCNEFANFQTSNIQNQLFSDDVPLQYFIQLCMDVFDGEFNREEIEQAVIRTNVLHGGLNIKATRVAYVFGMQDPWYPLGITSTIVPRSPAIFVDGGSHVECTYMISETDSDLYQSSCKIVENLVRKWTN